MSSGLSFEARPWVPTAPPLLYSACLVEPPARDFVIPGLLAGTLGVLSAPGSTGKSFLALELAACVACPEANKFLLGLDIKKHGPVLVLCAEDPAAELQVRIHAITRKLPPEIVTDLDKDLRVWPLLGSLPDICNPTVQDWVIANGKGCRLIVIDTLTRFHALDENSNGEMSYVLACAERVAAATGAAVLLLHHIGKSAAMNGQGDQQGAARGASAIIDNARYAAHMVLMTAEEATIYGIKEGERWRYLRWGGNKHNYSSKEPDVWLTRNADSRGVLMPVQLNPAVGTTSPLPLKKQQDTKGRKRA